MINVIMAIIMVATKTPARDIIEQVMKVRGLWMRDFDAQND